MMAKNPRDRYQNAKELANELDEVAATLTTSEAKPANLIPRIFAFGIDLFLACLMARLMLRAQATPAHVLLILMIYAWITVALRGRTIGKSICGLRVVDRAGQPLTWARSFCRAICYTLSIVPFGAGLIWALLNRKHDSLHDLVTHTRVVTADNGTA